MIQGLAGGWILHCNGYFPPLVMKRWNLLSHR